MPDETNNDNVIDLQAIREGRQKEQTITTQTALKVNSGTFEFHLISPDGNTETVTATGYMKFGPQFLAVVDGPEDDSMVLFATATHLVRYIRKVGSDGDTQGTLSL
jgi:hypothetical protein